MTKIATTPEPSSAATTSWLIAGTGHYHLRTGDFAHQGNHRLQQIAEVPMMPAFVRGVIDLRGRTSSR